MLPDLNVTASFGLSKPQNPRRMISANIKYQALFRDSDIAFSNAVAKTSLTISSVTGVRWLAFRKDLHAFNASHGRCNWPFRWVNANWRPRVLYFAL
eukprot:7750490-Karenia_brevis.AAC.1